MPFHGDFNICSFFVVIIIEFIFIKGKKAISTSARLVPSPSASVACASRSRFRPRALVVIHRIMPVTNTMATTPMIASMPSWAALSDTDLAAVVTYTKNAWSNKTGQLVQPAEIVALRAK